MTSVVRVGGRSPRLLVGVLIAVAIGVVVLTRDLGACDVPPVPAASVGPVASLEEFCAGVQTVADARAAHMTARTQETGTALGREVRRLRVVGIPAATPAAAVAGVRMLIDDALREAQDQAPVARGEAEEIAYGRLGKFLTESCGAGR
ncbi:hypothetical protein J2S40_001840 [Nocardioides luteus]|uniref:hypothetical protein n=1 Tax=Nocardioides luteus TaxID=1844 RepID=UPI001664003C|nr:hypothetical protein [Nocardioides luteus]MDR7310782.1 hypothetical protein [Nocardioides luteus]